MNLITTVSMEGSCGWSQSMKIKLSFRFSSHRSVYISSYSMYYVIICWFTIQNNVLYVFNAAHYRQARDELVLGKLLHARALFISFILQFHIEQGFNNIALPWQQFLAIFILINLWNILYHRARNQSMLSFKTSYTLFSSCDRELNINQY